MNKVTVFGRIFTSLMSDKILVFRKVDKNWELVGDWFEIRFHSKEERDRFMELVKDIDKNRGISLDPLNIVKITFENALTEKDKEYMKKKDKENEIENRKFCDKVMRERIETELKLYRSRLKETEEAVNNYKKSIKEFEEKLNG